MKLEEKIVSNFSKLNTTDKHIWNYINNNKQDVIHMTINELAANTNVSRTTISRFVTKIGYSGYSEFKFVLKGSIETKEYMTDSEYEDVCNSLIKYIEQQKNTDYIAMCQLIYNAERIFVYGTGSVQKTVAKELKRLLATCHELVYELSSSDVDPAMFHLLNEKDVVILISLSGNNEAIIDVAQKINLQGASILSMTDFHNNKLQELSDESLYIVTPELQNWMDVPDYKLTSLFFVLTELFVIRYGMYKQRQEQ